nr:unnamed protein product [Callosobruchus analis]
MPRHCCVPGCKINYCFELKSSPYISVSRSSKNEELKSKWLAAIPRKSWSPSKESVNCSSHFRIYEILTAEAVLLDGLHNTMPLKPPKLLEGPVRHENLAKASEKKDKIKWFLVLNTQIIIDVPLQKNYFIRRISSHFKA